LSGNDHPLKVAIQGAPSDSSLTPERGWYDMDVKWLVTRGTMGASKTVVGRTRFPPGGEHALHRHPNAEEWEFIISGVGLKQVGGDSFLMHPGDVCFCPQNVYHGLKNASETEPLVTIWGYCGAGSLEEAGYLLPEDE
jgi:quercetin dioxygenase-like cupin family protein